MMKYVSTMTRNMFRNPRQRHRSASALRTQKPTSNHTHTRKKRQQQALRQFGRIVKSPSKFAVLLNNLCETPGKCLTFAQYVKPTKTFFHDFWTFQDAAEYMIRIGNGANGGVYQIEYAREGIVAHTIMKIAIRSGADNLYYEYFVGKHFINHCNLHFPCFLETYALFDFPTTSFVQNYVVPTSILKTLAVKFDMPHHEALPYSCQYPTRLAVFSQYLDVYANLGKYVNARLDSDEFLRAEWPQLLYQIYGPLAVLGDTFTHYDLHEQNVLLYHVGEQQYLQLEYMDSEGTPLVSVKTHLVCKIIDYGRSYFYTDASYNSGSFHKDLCAACRFCGRDQGYRNFYHTSDLNHDLYLLYSFQGRVRQLRSKTAPPVIQTILDTRLSWAYISSQLEGRIANVVSAAARLQSILMTKEFQKANDKQYKGQTCIGRLEIHLAPLHAKKPMRYIPVARPSE